MPPKWSDTRTPPRPAHIRPQPFPVGHVPVQVSARLNLHGHTQCGMAYLEEESGTMPVWKAGCNPSGLRQVFVASKTLLINTESAA